MGWACFFVVRGGRSKPRPYEQGLGSYDTVLQGGRAETVRRKRRTLRWSNEGMRVLADRRGRRSLQRDRARRAGRPRPYGVARRFYGFCGLFVNRPYGGRVCEVGGVVVFVQEMGTIVVGLAKRLTCRTGCVKLKRREAETISR